MKIGKIIAAMLIVAAVVCFLTSCTDSDEDIELPQGDTHNTVQQNIVGEITYVGESYISLKTYISDEEINDYSLLDKTTLSETETVERVDISEDTNYQLCADGVLSAATREELYSGAFVASTYEDDIHTVIIYEESKGIDAEIGTVLSDNLDGSITITVCTLTEENAGYRITDLSDVQLSAYADTIESKDIVIPDNSVVMKAESGELVAGSEEDISVGDSLVITKGTDDIINTVIIYKAAENE